MTMTATKLSTPLKMTESPRDKCAEKDRAENAKELAEVRPGYTTGTAAKPSPYGDTKAR
jgi:hypothetical protein